MRRVLCLILLAAALPVRAADPVRDARWREDLQYLATELPRRHPNLFSQMTRGDFERAVAELDQRIPDLSDAEVIVGMMRIVAMAGDSHTSIFPPSFRSLPIGLRWFQDGLFVTAVAQGYRQALGGRVVQIGDASVERAYALVETVISHENEAKLRHQSAWFLTVPEILYALRITPRLEPARYILEKAGGVKLTLELAAEPAALVQAPDAGRGFVPLWQRNTSRNYWYEYLPGAQALYVAYNACADITGYPFSVFTEELLAAAAATPVEQLILDLRNNSGGNSEVIRPLLNGLAAQGGADAGQRVRVIIGRRTASSAVINAITLADQFGATLIGEPTSGKPNHYGNVLRFELPNSKLPVQHSTRFFRLRPNEDTASLMPALQVEEWSADYFARHDPFLAAALAWPGRYESPRAPAGSPATVSAASFRTPVSAGALATVFGDFRGAASADAVTVPLPKELGGAQVLVNGVAAPLVAVRAGQVNFQVPQATAVGRTQVRVTVAGREVAAGEAEVATASPGVFLLDAGSLDQPGAVLNQDSGINSEARRARRGEVIQIFATGAGAVSGVVEDGAPGPREPLAETWARPRVWIGVQEAAVLFSGLSPQFPGLWQINVRVPEQASVSRQMPLLVWTAGRASNGVTVWVEP